MGEPDFSREAALGGRVAGIDEVGRGPLAGPVTAAAVILSPGRIPDGLADSKTLRSAARARLAVKIAASAATALGWASPAEIDRLNILGATRLAMCRAVAALAEVPDHALVDGNSVPPDLGCPATAVVRGDGSSLSIAAASILAKVARDDHMVALAQHFPGYGWERNAGYPTRAHRQALTDLGLTPQHRRSFAPVRDILCRAKSPTP